MHLKASSVDDLLRKVFNAIKKGGRLIKPSKGDCFELVGVALELTRPRARLSRTETKGTVFSCIGEFLWYISGRNDLAFIHYYLSEYEHSSNNNSSLSGAYGPRLFSKNGINQMKNVADILRNKTDSRQAVIQIFDAGDITDNRNKDVPCTCVMQFFKRDGKLHMVVYLRSNDAFKGLPHDIFAFTMIQEIMAINSSLKLGTYKHMVGSLHIYKENLSKIETFLDEGWQSRNPMPPMPPNSLCNSISRLLEIEEDLRTNKRLIFIDQCGLDEYWKDLARLLKIFSELKSFRNLPASDFETRRQKLREIERIKNQMHSAIYEQYIRQRTPPHVEDQLELPLGLYR
jgi:thymidylate synthase